MAPELLSPQKLEEFRKRVTRLEHPRELVIDVLRAIQEEYGWVPDEGVVLTASLLGLSPLQVEEIATFYDKIFRQPVGRRVIHVCDSICCWSRGSEGIVRHLQDRLGIGLGETTADGAFTLLPTCCLGACGQAPAMMIGFTLHGHLDAQKIDAILAAERTGGTP
ncbi:MAG: NADH-quinone oxidoreductase subunit NuoE [Desulfuromonadales bacterium]